MTCRAPTSTVGYLYDGEGNGVEQQVTTGGTTTTYYYAGGQRVVLAVKGVFSYLASDGLGSANVALDANGAAQAVTLYAPYGTTRYSSGSMPGTYGYTGQHADAATGLDYYGARSYDSAAGQFASADTVLASLNRYGYVGGDPENATDPSGRCMVPRSPRFWERIGHAMGLASDIVQALAAIIGLSTPPGPPLSRGYEPRPTDSPPIAGPPPPDPTAQPGGTTLTVSPDGSDCTVTTEGAGGQGATQAQPDTGPYYQGHGTDPNTWWKPNHSYSGPPTTTTTTSAFHMPVEARAQHYVEINVKGTAADPAAAPNVVYTAQQSRQNSIDWQWDYYASNDYLFSGNSATQQVCDFVLLDAACGGPGGQGQQHPNVYPAPSSPDQVPWWQDIFQFFDEPIIVPGATPPHSHVS